MGLGLSHILWEKTCSKPPTREGIPCVAPPPACLFTSTGCTTGTAFFFSGGAGEATAATGISPTKMKICQRKMGIHQWIGMRGNLNRKPENVFLDPNLQVSGLGFPYKSGRNGIMLPRKSTVILTDIFWI